MIRTISKLMLTGIAVAAAASAGAAEVVIDPAVTVRLSDWTYGSGHAVDVATPAYKGQGGGFKGTLSDAGAYNDASFETYCVQIGQDFAWNTTYKDYRIIQGDTYALWAHNPATAGQIGQLMTYVDTLAPLTSVQSTGVQLAIWELIYEKPSNGYTLDKGVFKNTPTASNTFANSLLASFASTKSLYKVDVLENDKRQDFLVLTAVPEPSSYAMALAGLAFVGFFTRKMRNADRNRG